MKETVTVIVNDISGESIEIECLDSNQTDGFLVLHLEDGFVYVNLDTVSSYRIKY